jgi:hypothetical protein
LEGKDVDLGRLKYIAVEEVVGDAVGLSVSDWPAADGKGRLRFTAGGAPIREVGAGAKDLCSVLSRGGIRRVPPHGAQPGRRVLRVGDVFAAEVDALPDAEEEVEAVAAWLTGPVFDITSDARLVAKLAYYGALTETWDRDQAAEYFPLDDVVEYRA